MAPALALLWQAIATPNFGICEIPELGVALAVMAQVWHYFGTPVVDQRKTKLWHVPNTEIRRCSGSYG
uniref:Putative secreted protein n=1 Tax=Ixodes ricinus TaxID=34613 RepID=A0A6B0U1L0_IXORI